MLLRKIKPNVKLKIEYFHNILYILKEKHHYFLILKQLTL